LNEIEVQVSDFQDFGWIKLNRNAIEMAQEYREFETGKENGELEREKKEFGTGKRTPRTAKRSIQKFTDSSR
jgi:hypothetical protein